MHVHAACRSLQGRWVCALIRKMLSRRAFLGTSLIPSCTTYISPIAAARGHTTPRARHVATKASAEQRKVLIPVADGSEEIEAVVTIDVLRRAGAHVTVASVGKSLEVVCSRGVKLVADAFINDVEHQSFDLIACPGGMPGAEHLRDSEALERMTRQQRDQGKLYAAICATPVVFLQTKGLMDGRKGTAHPAFAAKLQDQSSVSSRVVVDGTLTTSRGPGTSFEFALSLVKQLYGEEKMQEVAGPMVMHPFNV